jgi:hypothetical protein
MAAVIDLVAANHEGRELELMLAGKKPLAMFYAEIGELPHEELIPEERFAPYVINGQFVRGETLNEAGYHAVLKRNVKVRYVLYALKHEAWRIPAMILAIKVQRKVSGPGPNEALDRITGALLGYTDDEVDAYCASYRPPTA